MLEKIRIATPEETEALAPHSDLTQGSVVWTFEAPAGKQPDHAVTRPIVELDPVFFSSDSGTSRRAAFIWAMENILRAQGAPEYYFNVAERDAEWRKAVEHWGAQPTSLEPEIRYRKNLR